MKLTFLASALAAVLGLALAGAPVTAQAQTATNVTAPAAPATATKTDTAAAAKKTPYKGQITAIDASSVTIKGAKDSITLAVTAATTFEFGTAKKHTPATAADFAVGDSVTGSYSKNADGTLTAASVRKKKATK